MDKELAALSPNREEKYDVGQVFDWISVDDESYDCNMHDEEARVFFERWLSKLAAPITRIPFPQDEPNACRAPASKGKALDNFRMRYR